MLKHFIAVIFLVFSFSIQAQELKTLDLETAVSQEYRSLYPDRLKGVEWISPTNFATIGDDGELMIRNTAGDTVRTIIASDLNPQLTKLKVDSIKSVRPYAWLDANTFLIRCGGDLVSVNTEDLTAKMYMHIPAKAENIEFSSASGYMAYTLENNVFIATSADSAIQVTNHSKESEISAGVAIHRSEFGITNGLFWSEDGKSLGFYEMDESMVTDYPLANYTPIPAEVNLIKYPMAGQKSHHAKTGIFVVGSEELVYLKTGEPLDHYLTNFTFSPDGKKAYLAEINRNQNEMKLNVYNAATGDFEKTLFTEIDAKYVEPEQPPYFPKGDGKEFLWMSERDGFNHIYSYTADGKLLKQVTKGNFDVLEINGQTTDGKTIIVTAVEGLIDRAIYAASVKSGKMKKLTAEKGSYQVTMDKGDNLMVALSSPEYGNKVTIVDVNGKVISTPLSAENPLEDYKIGEMEFPIITAADGTKLQGRLIKPYDFDASKKYPVIVYVYGGPHAQMVRNDYKGGANVWMYEAANRGYIVFTVDNRGSGNRGMKFEQAVFRNLGTVEMEDQLKGVEYLKTLPYVDADKMAVHGWSFGGFMTTSLMLRHPGVFKIGVAGGPVTDWRMYEIMYGERYMDTPEQNPEGYKIADLKNYADQLEGDLLLIHGLDDNVVVPQHSYTLLQQFVTNGKQVDFFTYPNHEHNVRGKDRVHLMTKVLDYIDLHFKE
ncbi:S9 family peptidase [Cryomorpha ignava]|uniref:S9 family peptidase n=1 Tax=Cryomorpha ignava TaxID=101383 RepID=A0A7K3WS96_9FLAO|nr:DPP IV N-terminal domain-containing protein [Cryomorpha ignava]NEN24354.1 S9 family peptidase [Cryomorpha ignava]